jgi:hypothetical protein
MRSTKKGVFLLLAKSLCRSIESNVAAFRHPFLQMRKPRQEDESDISSYTPSKPQHVSILDQLLPARPVLRQTQAMTVRWAWQAGDQISAYHLAWRLSTSNRVGKERSLMRGCDKAAAGRASNTSFDGNRLGWTAVVSPRQNCCKTGGDEGVIEPQVLNHRSFVL